MLKRKSKNKDRKVSKSQLIIVGSLLIVVGSLLRGYRKNKKLVNKADTDNNE